MTCEEAGSDRETQNPYVDCDLFGPWNVGRNSGDQESQSGRGDEQPGRPSAIYFPARRAPRVDPVEAPRTHARSRRFP